MPARMPSTTTTISISMSVKPWSPAVARALRTRLIMVFSLTLDGPLRADAGVAGNVTAKKADGRLTNQDRQVKRTPRKALPAYWPIGRQIRDLGPDGSR